MIQADARRPGRTPIGPSSSVDPTNYQEQLPPLVQQSSHPRGRAWEDVDEDVNGDEGLTDASTRHKNGVEQLLAELSKKRRRNTISRLLSKSGSRKASKLRVGPSVATGANTLPVSTPGSSGGASEITPPPPAVTVNQVTQPAVPNPPQQTQPLSTAVVQPPPVPVVVPSSSTVSGINQPIAFYSDDKLLPLYYDMMSDREKELFTSEMQTRGFPPFSATTPWPFIRFARLYINGRGCHEILRKYCMEEVARVDRRAELENAVKLKHRVEGRKIKSRSPSVDIETELRQSRLQRERLTRSIMDKRPTDHWNRESVPRPLEVDDMIHLFSDIDELQQQQLLDNVEVYNDSSRDLKISDWCYYAARIAGKLAGRETKFANFTIFSNVQPMYRVDLLRTLGDVSRTITPKVLLRRIGRVVYTHQHRDPLKVCKHLKFPQLGCTTKRALFNRIVDLHHCRTDNVDHQDFLLDIFMSIASKINRFDRYWFYHGVFRTFPAFKRAIDLTKSELSTLNEASLKGMDMYLSGPCYPEGNVETENFCDYLVMEALGVVPSLLEKSYFESYADPYDPVFGHLRLSSGPPATKYVNPVSDMPDYPTGAVCSVMEPWQELDEIDTVMVLNPLKPPSNQVVKPEGVAARETPVRKRSKSRKSKKNEGELNTPARQATPARATTTTSTATPSTPQPASKSSKLCNYCHKTTHDEGTCWAKYPELKEKHKAERAAKAKANPKAKAKGRSTSLPPTRTNPAITKIDAGHVVSLTDKNAVNYIMDDHHQADF